MERLKIETPGQEQRAFQDLCADISRRIRVSPMGLCPVDITLNVIRMCHAQSCGKCTPCRVGLGQLANMLESVLDGAAQTDILEKIELTSQTIIDTADCAIGYEAAKMARNSVANFRQDYLSHIQDEHCMYGLKHAVPCTAMCPAHVDVPGYIALVKAGRNEDAIRLIRKDNPFPSVCGYVCEHPCENHCRRRMLDDAVNICGIKRYAADQAGEIETPVCQESTGKKVAIVGGGPGGLTTAYFLTLMGHQTVVYEQRPKLGGMLRYGIPDYRLPQTVLEQDIQYILDTGVEAVLNTNIGEDISIEELKEKYHAVYISIGAHDDKKLGIDGEDCANVISAVEMLRNIGEGRIPNLDGKRVCVIGGGNVAMDATRTSLRLGASHVTCVYRRRVDDMTALPEEIHEAQMEGAEILPLHAPERIEADEQGQVKALWAQPQIISKIGPDGRPSIRKAEKEPVRLSCDYIIIAIGQAVHLKPFEESGIRTNRGAIQTEQSSYVRGSGNVFAGGDAVSGPATVIRAVAAGKVAADNIDQFLGYHHTIQSDVEVPAPQHTNTPPCGRVNLAGRSIECIKDDFDLVSIGMSNQEMEQECSRCLRCDHFGYGILKGGRNIQW